MSDFSSMRQSKWMLDAHDGHTIHGYLNRNDNQPSDRAVVMVHGLTCSAQTHPFPLATLRFLEEGYDVIRFEVHSDEKNARNSAFTNLEDFAHDTKVVIDHFKTNYPVLFVIGHSCAGSGIMIANPAVNAASLWDTTYASSEEDDWMEDITEDIGNSEYKLFWNNTYVFKKERELVGKKYSQSKCRELSRAAKFPVQVILAENYSEATSGESFHSYSPHPSSNMIRYPDTNHFFDNLPDALDMIDRTVAFFEQH